MGGIIEEYVDSIQLIWIVGHTDSVPISTSEFPNNMWLSSGRANTVNDYLVNEVGIPYELSFAMGCGEKRPVADNATPEGREMNRRVEFTIASQNNTDDLIPGSTGGGIF